MFSIAPKACAAAFTLILFFAGARAAAPAAPAMIYDPAFHLPYSPAKVRFEPLAPETWANCATLNYLHNTVPVWFIFGKLDDGKGSIYYAAGGYEINRPGVLPRQPRFETGGRGLIFRISGNSCLEIGDVQETFNARYFDETPQEVLQNLAIDMARRYSHAFGGATALKAAFKRHQPRPDASAVELQAAFARYMK